MKEYGDYHGDEDEIASERRELEENDPRHEPNFDDEIKSLEGCTQCNDDYLCFDCEYHEMSWVRGYTLQDNLTWEVA